MIGSSSIASGRPPESRTSIEASTCGVSRWGRKQATPLEEMADCLVHRGDAAIGIAHHHPFDHVVEDALHLGGAPLHHHRELGELLPARTSPVVSITTSTMPSGNSGQLVRTQQKLK